MIPLSSISIDKRIEDMEQAAERSRTFMSLFAMKFTTVVEAAAKSL